MPLKITNPKFFLFKTFMALKFLFNSFLVVDLTLDIKSNLSILSIFSKLLIRVTLISLNLHEYKCNHGNLGCERMNVDVCECM